MKNYLLPILLLMLLCLAIFWKYQEDIATAKENYKSTLQLDAELQRDSIEDLVKLIHQGISNIANLPDIRTVSLDGSSLDVNILRIIKLTYDDLASNVGIMALYIMPAGSTDQSISAQSKWKPPILVLNPEFHFSSEFNTSNPDLRNNAQNKRILSDVEINALDRTDIINQQLNLMSVEFQTRRDVLNERYPAIVTLQTDKSVSNSLGNVVASGDKDKSWLIYSAPFFGNKGDLKGSITVVLPVNQLSKRLANPNNILINTEQNYVITHSDQNIWQVSKPWIRKNEPDPDLLYSELLHVDIPDLMGKWILWFGRPNELFWSRADVASARSFAIGGFASSVLLTSGLIVFIRLAKKQRRLIEERNTELEKRVDERTNELKSALQDTKKVAIALKNSEERNRAVVSYAVDGIISINQRGMVLTFNPAAEKIFGYARDEVVGKQVEMLMPEPYKHEHQSYIDKYISTGERKVIGVGPREVIARRKNGEQFPMDLALSEMRIGNTQQYLAMVRDITRRKRNQLTLQKDKEEQEALIQKLQATQDQLLQSEKMASIGQLAAGVAHEINNPVGYINSNINSLRKYIEDFFRVLDVYEKAEPALAGNADIQAQIQSIKDEVDITFLKEDVLELMNESNEGVTRVKQIVQNLKDFSHVDEADWQWTNLHNGLDSTLNIVHNEIKYKAEVVKEYGDVPEIECIPSQINQVFLNLLVNASQAIEERGVITVRSGTEGENIWITVSDTGKGIEPQKLSKIFDPFFTTKPVGKGTGLGLSLSYGIIHKHKGSIYVESEVGKGTTFRITLPIRQGNIQDEQSTDSAEKRS